MSDAKPYALATFEADFYESVSSNDIAQHVQDRLLATVQALDAHERESECQVDGIPPCHEKPGATEADWCRMCLVSRYRQSQNELALAQIAVNTANDDRDAMRVDLEAYDHERDVTSKIAARLARELEVARAFKSYVHKRLDDAGIPVNPEPEQNAKHGCRIEGRLNVALYYRDLARQDGEGAWARTIERMFMIAHDAAEEAARDALESAPLQPVNKMEPDMWSYWQRILGSYDTTMPSGARIGKRWTRTETPGLHRVENPIRYVGEFAPGKIIWRTVEIIE